MIHTCVSAYTFWNVLNVLTNPSVPSLSNFPQPLPRRFHPHCEDHGLPVFSCHHNSKGRARPKLTFIPKWFVDIQKDHIGDCLTMPPETLLNSSPNLTSHEIQSGHFSATTWSTWNSWVLWVSPTEERGMLATNQMGGACTVHWGRSDTEGPKWVQPLQCSEKWRNDQRGEHKQHYISINKYIYIYV